ncbi:oligoendopeptidase F [Christensenellaceae bacterium OttesenSCG-928-L17]|nr:oligoendopeptidase F [Christensenellaceae bacterium OttesenSCG-928-L17]
MANNIPARNEIDPALTWDLTAIFSTDSDFEQAFAAAEQELQGLAALAGTLSSPAALLHALEQDSRISLMIEKLYVYARMKRDEDNSVSLYQGMADRAMQLSVRYNAAAAFLAPEILAIPEDVFNDWLNDNTLSPYRRVLANLARGRAHTLSSEEETLLALAGEPLTAADTIFSMLNNADLRFGEVADANGARVELTQENYRSFLESPVQSVRKGAYEALYAAYTALKNTLSASYGASVKTDVFYARARKYPSALESALYDSNVPVRVYDSLIDAVESRLPTLGKYLELRRRALHVEQLHMYDLYTPIVADIPVYMHYEDAKALVKRALLPLGDDYARMLEHAYNDGWIDVCENRGKTTGAYSWGAYGTHPYVLLNYQPQRNYAFTLAHELGHAMHTHYSDTAQPYQDAQYRIMAAEVASTVNEVLLLKCMLNEEKDPRQRAYLLNYYLEQFRTTVFRQTMFAAFERRTHEMAEAGEPLTMEALCAEYGKLNERYYPGVVVDDAIRMEWARIPHFYNAFYVYQYATGFCAAVKLASDILEGGEALARYLAFLKSGCTDFPIALLQHAGVDLENPASITSALDEFDTAFNELTALLAL